MNLKQALTKTDMNPISIPRGSGPCKTPCTTCWYQNPTEDSTIWTTKENISIQGRFNCKTKNVIYALSCQICGLQYFGQMRNTFNKRFRAHLTDIRQGNAEKPVSQHFRSNGHSVDDVAAVIVTQTSDNINIGLRTEEAWIYN